MRRGRALIACTYHEWPAWTYWWVFERQISALRTDWVESSTESGLMWDRRCFATRKEGRRDRKGHHSSTVKCPWAFVDASRNLCNKNKENLVIVSK